VSFTSTTIHIYLTYTSALNVYEDLIRKPDGRRPLGIPWHSWEENIKMNLKKIWNPFVCFIKSFNVLVITNVSPQP
jgi:hypothetical protein